MLTFNVGYAQENGDIGENDFAIIPKSEIEVSDIISNIAVGGEVTERYSQKAEELSLADQFATGVMNWDTLLNYIVYLAKFLGQLGLLIAAMVIIRIGYQKAMEVFKFADGKIGKIISGILVIIFAYAIVRFLYYAFIS